MNWLSWLKNAAKTVRTRFSRSGYVFTPYTQAGKYVDEEIALRYSAVWACVRVISETIATLPWCVYKRTAKGREEDSRSNIYWILHNQPNPEMTAFSFKEMMLRRALLCGNAYAEIERDASGRPLWLWPIDSERVRVERDEQTRQVVYRISDQSSSVTLAAADVFHLKGPGGDGLTGFSMIRYAAESVGLGLAMDEFGSSFFGNGAHVSLVIKHPNKLSDQALEHLKQSLAEKNSGKKSLSPMVIEEGMSIEKMGVPPEEAQFLESRKWQVLDIARWYRMPPHKLGILDRATYTNIEQSAIEFVSDAIIPWCVRLEQEADLKLYGRNNHGVCYTKLNVGAILRGDMKSRYDSYAVGRQWGWLSANDVLDMEDSNPIPGGDIYMVPVNMTTPEALKKQAAMIGQPAPSAAPVPGQDPLQQNPPAQAKKLNGKKNLNA